MASGTDETDARASEGDDDPSADVPAPSAPARDAEVPAAETADPAPAPTVDVAPAPKAGVVPAPKAAAVVARESRPVAPQPPAATTPMAEAVIESFLLRDAAARSSALPPGLRAKLRADLALVTQRRDAAEVLARHGHPAEAFVLARRSFAGARAIADSLVAKHAPGVAFPGAIGLTESAARAVSAAAKLADRDTPERDDAFANEDERALASLLEIAPVLERRLDRLTAPARDLWLLRIRRVVVAALAIAAFLAAVVYVATPKREMLATASAWWGSSDDEHPRNAVDGDESTEWHLPDAALGFLEIRPSPSRDIRAVRLLDTRNPPFFDRITTRVRVTVFSGDRQLGTRESTFAATPGPGRWLEIPMDARGVDRVRIDVLAFQQKGGGLTEVVLVDR